MKKLTNWYLNQALSSKVLLVLMASTIVVFLLFEFAIEPWKKSLGNLRSQVNEKAVTVSWMESQYQKNRILITNASRKQTDVKVESKISLITRIEQSAKKQKIYSSIERITPDKAGRVKVWINKGDFKKWIGWIESLKKQNINVESARINQSDKKGPVAINVTFHVSH